ncbi:hypothetical protein [Flavobacterium sp.]|uniref:hypothetical protein n=1 Tax=Flavobacterium sp. TaxID=239 RepID=UPI0035295F82
MRREILESNDSIFQNIDSTYFILFEVCDYDWTHSNWNLIAIDDKRFLYEKDDFFKDYKIENYDKDNSDFEFCIDMIKKDDLENLFKENHSDCMQDTHIFIINSKNLKIIRYIKVDCFSDPYHELEGS